MPCFDSIAWRVVSHGPTIRPTGTLGEPGEGGKFQTAPLPNAVTDIADLETEPLDEGIGGAQARVRAVGRAGEVGLVLLEVVEALALKAARRLKDQAEDEAVDPAMVAAARDLAQAYGKISRSIRQNALLEERLEAGVQGRTRALDGARRAWSVKTAEAEAARIAEAEEAAWQEANGERLEREEAVVEAMEQITFSQCEHSGDVDDEVADLLEQGAGFEAYGERPVSETVARLCKALNLEPDWDEFAREDWAKEEARAGVAGSPYVSCERGGTGECVLAVRGLQGAGLAEAAREGTGPP
jgi:hypothetical protein